jgi:hypothetical protein
VEPSLLFVPFLVVAVVVSTVAVARSHRAVGDDFLTEWARAHALDLTPENRPLVGWYLRTAGVLRTWGAIGGVVVPAALALAWSGHFEILGIDTDGGINPGDIGWIFVGYLVGALYAEVSLARPVDPARRSASLAPRRLDDYLPHRLVWAQRLLGGACVIGALASLALPYGEAWRAPGAVGILGFVAWIALVAAGVESLERWLVRRPQPFTDPSLVAADDAIRSQSVHSVAGAGLALLLFMVAGVSVLVASADVAILRRTMWLPALVATLAALGACQYYGHRAWRVRRAPLTPPITPPGVSPGAAPVGPPTAAPG